MFAVLGTAGVVTPAVVYVMASERTKPALDRWKTWVVYNDAIMFVVFLVYGSLFSKGLGGLLG